MKRFLFLIATTILLACQTASEQNQNAYSSKKSEPSSTKLNSKKKTQAQNHPTPKHLSYSWQNTTQSNSNLINRFSPPKGFKRVHAPKGSFAEWLRYLPLQKEGTSVKLHNGKLKWNQFVHEAIVDIDIGKADLQQCADAVMRLKAEYHYSKKEYEKIHFNYTSGHKVSFDDWRKGKRPKVSGNSVSFQNNGKVSDAYSNFKKYLIQIFSYAGTASLTKELKAKRIKNIAPGDVFIQGGFPGHAVLVLDVAEDEEGGRVFMIGQSYMPAQSFHVLKNKEDAGLSPWYSADVEALLETPEWTFKRGDLKEWGL
ncbi:MAG: DUF4846 domain-containing protein [Saprospiraceae bacterium]